MEDNKKLPKTPQIFFCKKCNYECRHNGDWNKHIRTAKHLNGNKPIDGWNAWKLKTTNEPLSNLRNKLI